MNAKNVEKTTATIVVTTDDGDVTLPAGVIDQFLTTTAENNEVTGAFARRILLSSVLNLAALRGGVDKEVSSEKLFKATIKEGANRGVSVVSLATLRRWEQVVKIHDQFGITPTEGSASAAYALTESGMTAAKKAVTELENVTNADDLVDVIVESINANPKKAKAVTVSASDTEGSPSGAGDVIDAPMTSAAFLASVKELFDRLPEEEKLAAAKGLRALGQESVKALA